MIKVAGFWNFGYNTPLTEYDIWRFPLEDFKVDKHIMCPITGIRAKNLKEYSNLEAMLKSEFKDTPGIIPVFVDEDGETLLEDFEHPPNCLYILGKPGYSPYKAHSKRGRSIKIRTPANAGKLWAHQALTIVLYDRMMKDGNNSYRQ